MLDCVPMRSTGIMHKSADDSYGMRNIRPYQASESLLPVHTVPTSYLPPPNRISGSLAEKAEDEWGAGSKLTWPIAC